MEFNPPSILDEPDTDPGKLFGDPKHAREDGQLTARAVREGWNLDRSEKDRIKAKVIGTLEDTEKEREVVRLAASLREMDKADVEADRAAGESGEQKSPVNVQVVIGGKDQPQLGRGELLPGLPVPNAFAEELPNERES